MYYNIVDLTGWHAPSRKLLGPYFDLARRDFALSLSYSRYELPPEEKKIFDDVDNADAGTKELKRLRRMVDIW